MKARAAKSKFGVGMRVRSNYRARWTGIIVGFAEYPRDHCAIVRITHDRRGNPIRKPNSPRNLHTLDCGWLEPI
jgi:hypothetical protein